MNANFVTMADSIGRPVERATLDLGDEKFIENIVLTNILIIQA